MLSVAKLTAGAEDYYLLSVAHGVEDYYTGAGEAPGYWTGKGAAALGLEGHVTGDALHTLLSGQSPVDGTPIRSVHAARATVAGFDLCFSAPKSVSLLCGLTTEATSDQRDALGELRAGDVAGALNTYEANQRVRECDSMEAARTRLVDDWFEERCSFPYKDSSMFAIRRADVEALNIEARDLLQSGGLIGATVYSTSAGQDFAYADEVICMKNDHRLGVTNGTRGRVVSVAPSGLTISTDAGHVRLPHAYMEAGHLAYEYASTVHKAQGTTVDTAFVLASGNLYREAAPRPLPGPHFDASQ